jgi:protein ImuA
MALRALSVVFEGEHDFGDAVWRADALARHASPAGVVATGHALLDAQLPGGGWPIGGLCEILQAQNTHSEWRLLLPALCAAPLGTATWVALVGPPHAPFGPALAAQGLQVLQVLWVKAQTQAERLWAAEQALRCAGVAAVLVWLPQAQASSLRRLQITAQTHAKLLFVMRPAAVQQESSPAVLRLLVQGHACGFAGVASTTDPHALHIQVLKRRGPPLAYSLVLPERMVGAPELAAHPAGAASATVPVPPWSRHQRCGAPACTG